MYKNFMFLASFVVVLTLVGSVATGEIVFLDDFEDGSATDGAPMTWSPVPGYNGSFDVIDGDYVLTRPSNIEEMYSFVNQHTLAGTSIRTQARLIGSNAWWLALLARANIAEPSAYVILMKNNARLEIWRFGPTASSSWMLAGADVGIDPRAQDVLLRFDVNGNELSAWAWREGDPMPTEPQVRTVHSEFATGVVGVAADLGSRLSNNEAIFRYVEVYEPNPPTPDYNIEPVANAGLPRYPALDPVVLDGTGSYDPDNSGPLSYTWRQIAGPSVIIIDANTATPTIAGSMIPGEGRASTPMPGGFTQTEEIQVCEFELIVSDGELSSLPDTVKVIIVPDFGESVLRLENDSFDPDKPTFIFFGGGNCEIGHAGQYINLPDWINRANIINFPYGYEPDPDGSTRTYYRYGDMILVYLSSVAPDYKQLIQTSGWSTGGQPAVDVGIRLNQIYADARYAVNHVTFLDAIPYCRNNYAESIEIFLGSSVDGEQCWIDNYVSTMGNQPNFHPNILNMRTESSAHPLAPSWYITSLSGEDMNQFNNGVIAGAYWSVVGPGKNLQLASTPGVEMYKFKWYGSESTGYMDFYDEPNNPGRLPEPVTLVGPEDGAFVDANGVVLSCEESENAVGYKLLFGSEPYRVMDYMIVSDTPEPPSEVITTFPFEQTFWTVRVSDAFGSTIYADPVCIYPAKVEAPEPNLVAYWKLDEEQGDIAYDSAGNIDATVYNGQWTEGRINGALDFNGLTTYMDCGDSLRLSTRQMTLAMWLEPQHMGGMRYVLSRAREGADDFDYVLMRHRYGEVEFAVAQEGSEPVSVMSNATTPLNEWTHVAVCLDGSEATIYINGQLDASAGYAQRSSCNGCWLWISSLGASTRYYNGKIDDIRIYNVALTADEVAALAQ